MRNTFSLGEYCTQLSRILWRGFCLLMPLAIIFVIDNSRILKVMWHCNKKMQFMTNWNDLVIKGTLEPWKEPF